MAKIDCCFWCGLPKDQSIEFEGAWDEKYQKDIVVGSYEPCDRCKELIGDGIHVMGATKDPIVEGMPPIIQDGDVTLYPTGSMFVATEQIIRGLLADDSADEEGKKELDSKIEAVLKDRVMFLPEETVVAIIEQIQEERKGEPNNEENVSD